MEIIPVTAFVDWNSQIHAANPSRMGPLDTALTTLRFVTRVIGRALYRNGPKFRFDVTLRIYHGWRRGFEASPNLRALITANSIFEFTGASNFANIIIRPRIYYGDELFYALPKRLHSRLSCHLPNTLRDHSFLHNRLEEKMVDTALASDVVSIAYREPERWLMILGEDDDIIPPLFVAEAARGPDDGRVLLIRRRSEGPFLKLTDLWCEP